jgi:type II secretory pathway component GspD/PulD (secretin)
MQLIIGFNRNLAWYLFLIALLHFLLPFILLGSETNQNKTMGILEKGEYELSVKDNLVSLRAEDAFLKKILEDIGQRMKIEVFARIPAEDKITIRFANLKLEEALKKFKTNYALVTDSKDKNGNIKRIVVVPEGQQANLNLKDVKKMEPESNKDVAGEETSKSEPFKFEFDPSKYE